MNPTTPRACLLIFLAVPLATPLVAQTGTPVSTDGLDGIYDSYERAAAAEAAGDRGGATRILESIAFESSVALPAATLDALSGTIEVGGLDRAIARYRLGTGAATNAYSELGERYLDGRRADDAVPVLSAAVVQRSVTLLEAIQAEDGSYRFGTLSHALIRARNIRNTFKYLNEVDVLEDYNLYRDLFNLASALEQTGHPQTARAIFGLVAGEPPAGPFRDSARARLESM